MANHRSGMSLKYCSRLYLISDQQCTTCIGETLHSYRDLYLTLMAKRTPEISWSYSRFSRCLRQSGTFHAVLKDYSMPPSIISQSHFARLQMTHTKSQLKI